jgi:ribosomal protein S18 acetylase RimI-like enzyme
VEIRELTEGDVSSVIALWNEVGLIRPWNDPTEDFKRALEGTTSAVLGTFQYDELIGTVMVGHDGHRGWVYYLAVGVAHQREGIGSELMTAAEMWLRDAGAVKAQLMVRRDNESAMGFYGKVGYETSDVTVLSRWLKR